MQRLRFLNWASPPSVSLADGREEGSAFSCGLKGWEVEGLADILDLKSQHLEPKVAMSLELQNSPDYPVSSRLPWTTYRVRLFLKA